MTFPQSWTAEILRSVPLIAPARHFVYPQRVVGEEDALERGALQLLVKPATGGTFLATCALGFRADTLPNGIWPCPTPDHMLAIAGGYAYHVDTRAPETCIHLPLRPVVQVVPAVADSRLILIGLHTILAIGPEGLAWHTPRLSSEGIAFSSITGGNLHVIAWDMLTDRDIPLTLRLTDGSVVSPTTHPAARTS